MKKVALRVAALAALFGGSMVSATTELRTPISVLYDFGSFHYPLDVELDECWSWDLFGAYYARRADKGYGPSFGPGENHVSRDTVSMSQLFFGKESFTAGESFAGGAGVVIGNPFVTAAKIRPVFHYSEKGIALGGHMERAFGCDNEWKFGARAVIPFKQIKVERDLACKPLEESIDDMVLQRQQIVDNITVVEGARDVYAYRLDFLTALRFPNRVPTPPIVSMVNYADATVANHVSISGEDITTAAPSTPNNTAPIYAVRSVDGTIGSILSSLNGPDGYNTIARNVAPAGNLAANGTGGANGDRMAFDAAVNYTPLASSVAAQSELFIIPNSRGNGYLEATAATVGQAVDQAIRMLINNPNVTAIDFLLGKGIDLCDNQRVNGFGDLDTQLFVGYKWCDAFYTDLYLGIIWPTGKRDKNPGHVYYQTAGNNGHYEIRVELDGGWQPCRWFGLDADISFNHAFRRIEQRAAAFKGATIRNIGPTVDAHVSYNYFVGHVNGTLFNPDCCNAGLVLSYELYAKGNDKLEFVSTSANDLNGVSQLLDNNIAQTETNALSNKFRAEMFYHMDCVEFFAGASRVFAGRNVMKETEAHIGLSIFF